MKKWKIKWNFFFCSSVILFTFKRALHSHMYMQIHCCGSSHPSTEWTLNAFTKLLVYFISTVKISKLLAIYGLPLREQSECENLRNFAWISLWDLRGGNASELSLWSWSCILYNVYVNKLICSPLDFFLFICKLQFIMVVIKFIVWNSRLQHTNLGRTRLGWSQRHL